MIIYPAIDIKDGKCVRLKQGRADESTIFFENPHDAAKLWMKKGAKALHVVDLDGAFNGKPYSMELISQVKKDTNLYVQMGGGIRDKITIENILSNNIDRIILGTAALNNMDLTEWAANKYKEKIAVSIDALNGKVAYNGWTGLSDISTFDFIQSMTDAGINTFIYTDISKDGMLNGPDIKGINAIKNRFNINIIASGGITTVDDIKTLKKIGVYGAIVGRALYNGNIELEEALEVAEECF